MHIRAFSPNHSYFVQIIPTLRRTSTLSITLTKCLALTILELRNQVGILTLRRAILEWYRFLLCAEHISQWLIYRLYEYCYCYGQKPLKSLSRVDGLVEAHKILNSNITKVSSVVCISQVSALSTSVIQGDLKIKVLLSANHIIKYYMSSKLRPFLVDTSRKLNKQNRKSGA